MSLAPNSFPALSREHVVGARLYADRNDLLSCLQIAEGGVVAEIGVAAGDFSEFILDQLKPRTFVAFDTFRLHEIPMLWGMRSAVLLEGKTQLEFFAQRFSRHGSKVAIEEGLNHIMMARYPDRFFDLVYVDAGHDYESVKRDANLAKEKLKPGGVIVFNDYIMFDHITGSPYGVVQAVNELIVHDRWHVVGFGLHHQMFMR